MLSFIMHRLLKLFKRSVKQREKEKSANSFSSTRVVLVQESQVYDNEERRE